MAAAKRFTTEQIVAKLGEMEKLQARVIRRAIAAAAMAAVAATLAGCGEPGLPTRGIALETMQDGHRMLVIEACSPVTRVDLGPGADVYGKRTVSIDLDGDAKSVQVALDVTGESSFSVGDARTLAALRAPFFVRVKGANGDASITTYYAHEPSPGYASTMLGGNNTSNTDVPIGELNVEPDCSFTG